MSFCYLRHYKLKITVFDLRGCTTLKIGKLSGHIPCITPQLVAVFAGYWSLNPGMCQIISLVEPGFWDQSTRRRRCTQRLWRWLVKATSSKLQAASFKL